MSVYELFFSALWFEAMLVIPIIAIFIRLKEMIGVK